MKTLTGKKLVLKNLFEGLTLGNRYQIEFHQYGHKHTLLLAAFENGGYMVEVSRTEKQNRQPECLVCHNFDMIMNYLAKRILKSTLNQLNRAWLEPAK